MSISLPRISITIGNDQHRSRGSLNLLSIGFALQLTWFFSAVLSAGKPFIADALLSAPPSAALPISLFICAGVALATFLFIGLTDRRFLGLYTSRRLSIGFALLSCLGTLALFGITLDGSLGITWNIVSGILTGIGSAGLILMWGVAFSRSSAPTIVLNTAVAVTCAIIINALIVHVIGYPAAGIVIAALPFISVPFLWARTPVSFTERHEDPIFEVPKLRRGAIAARIVVPLLLFGIGLGAMTQVASRTILFNDDMVSLLLSLFAGCTIVLIALIGIFSADKGNQWEFLFRPLLPAIVISMFFIPSLLAAPSAIAAIIVLAGFLCFMALMWIFFGLICQEYRSSPFFVFGFGFVCLTVGAIGGSFLMIYHGAIDALMPFGPGGAALIAAAAVIIASGFYPRVGEIDRLLTPVDAEEPAKTENASAPEETTAIREERTPREATIPAEMPVVAPYPPVAQPAPTAFIPPMSPVTPMTPPNAYGAYYPGTPQPIGPLPGSTEAESVESQTYLYTSTRRDVHAFDGASASPLPVTDDLIPAGPAPRKSEPAKESATNDEGRHPSRFRLQCDSIAERYLLSRREREVMQLLARGHNAAYIQEKLCISRSTAKTHITHIYRKLDIHTQQELLTMVDEHQGEISER